MNNKLSRLNCLILSIILSAAASPHISAAVLSDNIIGAQATWNFADNTLTISGEGKTYSYDEFDIYEAPADERPWAAYNAEISAVVVENGITKLGNYLFAALPNLKSVTIADSVINIGSYCFADCPNLKTVDLPASAGLGLHLFDGDSLLFPDADFQVLNGSYLYSYTGDSAQIVSVPGGIETLGAACFAGHSEIRRIALPSQLKTIGSSAFQNCTNLKQIDMASKIKEISASAFAGCTALTSIEIPKSVQSLDINAFEKCTSLSAVRFLGNHITTIPPSCFSGCSNLTAICLPDSVTSIEGGAFSGCEKLQKIEIADQLESIGESAFAGCTALAELHLPDTLQSAAYDAFTGCDAFISSHTVQNAFVIDNVFMRYLAQNPVCHIPDGIVTVMNNAFSNRNVVAVWFPDSVRYIRENAFTQCSLLTDFYAMSESAAAQYAAENRIGFQNILADVPQGKDMALNYTADGWYFGNSKSVFGDDYYLSDADQQHLTDFGINTHSDNTWSGSCVGLAVSVILAKNGVFSPAQLQTGAKSLSDIEPTDDAISFINYFQCIQGQDGTSSAYEPGYLKFYRMLNIAKNIPYGESPFLLTFATASGSHGVVGYGQETGSWTFDGKTYNGRILVWDSNFPKALHEESCLYYDSETFDYCIPYYGVHVADGAENNTAGIITVCNDIDVLNAYPYPFYLHVPAGDINCDGSVNVADVVLLLKHLTAQTELTDSQLRLADISGDLKVNAVDLTLLKRNLMKN